MRNSYTLLKEENFLSDNIINLFDEIFTLTASINSENIKTMIQEGKITVSILINDI